MTAKRKKPGPSARRRARQFAQMRAVGARMAVACHNLSQPEWTITLQDRCTLKSLQREWDAIFRTT